MMMLESGSASAMRTGLAESLLQEIAQLLTTLGESGQPAAIDLRSLPMTEADRSELEERLGRGEVDILLTVAGKSEIWETQYAGVWWVRHFGADDRVAAERIEITACPQILVTHDADIAAACARLRDELAAASEKKDAENV
jgi:HupH hydrogenase expression protein, C-terminal conserved region